MGIHPPDVAGALSSLFEAALALFGRNAMASAAIASFLESLVGLGVLFPGGTVVVLSGFAVRAQGAAGFAQVVAAAWLGMTLGTVADYWLGRIAGRRLVPRRAPWRLRCRWRHTLRNAHGFMSRWGWWAILAANLAGPGRAAVAVAAGASGWSFGKFLGAQAVASLGWSTLYCALGYFAAGRPNTAGDMAENLGWGGFAVIAFAVAGPPLILGLARVLIRLFRPPPRVSVVRAVAGDVARSATTGQV